MSGLNCAILMRAPLRLSLHVEILIIGSTRFFLRNLVNRLMIALLGLSPLSIASILVVHLHAHNERAKQLLYVLDDHVWGMKITALEESADFAIIGTEKLFSKIKIS
jgi:hypothetical protein